MLDSKRLVFSSHLKLFFLMGLTKFADAQYCGTTYSKGEEIFLQIEGPNQNLTLSFWDQVKGDLAQFQEGGDSHLCPENNCDLGYQLESQCHNLLTTVGYMVTWCANTNKMGSDNNVKPSGVLNKLSQQSCENIPFQFTSFDAVAAVLLVLAGILLYVGMNKRNENTKASAPKSKNGVMDPLMP